MSFPVLRDCVPPIVDLRHGAVLLPPEGEPKLNIRVSLRGAVGLDEIRKPGVPDGVGVDGFVMMKCSKKASHHENKKAVGGVLSLDVDIIDEL